MIWGSVGSSIECKLKTKCGDRFLSYMDPLIDIEEYHDLTKSEWESKSNQEQLVYISDKVSHMGNNIQNSAEEFQKTVDSTEDPFLTEEK